MTLPIRPSAVVLIRAALILVLIALSACNQPDNPTSTPVPTATAVVTATPTQTERVVTAVRAVFDAQVEAVKAGDWPSVYSHCSPGFRQLRTVERFTQDASAEFARGGFTSEGFEARNVRVSVRSPDRVLVTFDAYQGGAFVRTQSVGQNYSLVSGRWWDDGTWCKLRVGA